MPDERRKTYEWLKANGFQATRVIPDSKGWYEIKGTPSAGKPGYEVPELKAWGRADGIGALLGARFGGLIDADYDCPGARAMAHWFFPPSPAAFGRKSTPKAHGLYRISGDEPFPTLQTKLPGKQQHGEGKTMLLELRGDVQDNGVHTVLPGSRHKGTGEEIRYEGQGPGALPLTDRAVLLAAFYELSVACLIAEGGLYPEHARHYMCGALSGMLMRLKWEQPRVLRVLSAVTEYLGADKNHLKQVPQTFEKSKDPKKRLYGAPMVRKLLTGDKKGNDTVNPVIALIEECTREGKPIERSERKKANTYENVDYVLSTLDITVAHDVFKDRFALIEASTGEHIDYLHKNSLVKLWSKAERECGVAFNKTYLEDSLTALAVDNPFNPVEQLLNGLEWDNVPRSDYWLSEHCGAKRDDYTLAVGNFLIDSIIKRTFEPGCDMKRVVVLEGPQDIGKSGLTRLLALNPDWHVANADLTGEPRKFIEDTAGKTVCELEELHKVRGKDVGVVKAAISRPSDVASRKWERDAQTVRRRSVFIATMNPELDGYLEDVTGNVRFLPVTLVQVNFETLTPTILQLFAERMTKYVKGARLELPKELNAAIAGEIGKREERDPYQIVIESRLDAVGALTAPAAGVTYAVRPETVYLAWLGIPVDRWDRRAQRRVSGIMQRLGFTSKSERNPDDKTKFVRVYAKLPAGEAQGVCWIKDSPEGKSAKQQPVEGGEVKHIPLTPPGCPDI